LAAPAILSDRNRQARKNPFNREDFSPFSDGMLVNPYKHKEFEQKGAMCRLNPHAHKEYGVLCSFKPRDPHDREDSS
jgi:hypothetical protein